MTIRKAPGKSRSKSTTVKTTFTRKTSISTKIEADAAIVWALLTNGSDYTRWNSTITSFEGDIEKGQRIKLKTTLDPKRTFKLKVLSMLSDKEMKWSSGAAPFFSGLRTYTLEHQGSATIFSMSEKIGGLMFPMAASSIPSFDESFEKFAEDLKTEAEIIQKQK